MTTMWLHLGSQWKVIAIVSTVLLLSFELLGGVTAYQWREVSPAERWPQFYHDGWDGIEPVYTSDVKVNWMAPFFSGTGLSSEATLFVLGVEEFLGDELVIDQHGDRTNYMFVNGVAKRRHKDLVRLSSRSTGHAASTIYVCQSDPDAWHPKPNRLPANRCPDGGGGLYTIGRTHVETDSLPMGWAAKLNKMDEVWVPTPFHRDLFINKGVDESKVVVVPQAADLEFFNPAVTRAMPLPGNHGSAFKFLSILNWEHRKGWDLLLRAYLSEFSQDDDVVLYLLTPEHQNTESLWAFLSEKLDVSSMDHLPDIEALPYIPQRDMPKLYKAVDAFVLPSRGEGWGRTITEAMCMQLPVIASEWSGPSAYLTEHNSYPIPITRMKGVPDGPLAGQRMGEPDIRVLRRHMREVQSHPSLAARRGQQAREDMRVYHPQRVGMFIAHHLSAIADMVDGEADQEF